MMWVEDGKIGIFKNMSMDVSYEKYCEINSKYGDDPIILHFRIGTEGPNDLGNCHPFTVNENVAFCHNGILSEYSTGYGAEQYPPYTFVIGGEKRDSDTILFNKDILKLLPDNFLDNESTMTLIEDYIGSGNKLVFLDTSKDKPSVSIVNKSAGTVDAETGIWYSNGTYKRFKQKYTPAKYTKCESCNRTLFTQKDIDMGLCDKCVANVCESCGDIKNDDTIIKISFMGKEVSLCPECLSLDSSAFLGLFDNELDVLCVVEGDVLEPTFSHSVNVTYFVDEVSDKYITVRIVNSQIGTSVTSKYTYKSFAKSFYTRSAVWED